MPILWDTTVALVNQLPSIPDPWWKWQPDASPLSSPSAVFTAMCTYLTIIFGGQKLMQNRNPFRKLHNTAEFRPLFMLHNLLLSLGSLWLLALMMEQMIPVVYKHGFFHAICAEEAWTSRMETLYIVNYLFKYWELADTCFLVVKKKSLQFLHVFHHTATAVLCFSQLNGRTSVSWAVISLNLGVHVVMYYYYFTTSAFPGYKPWYKKLLTGLQITQFVLDLGVVYFASYSYFSASYFPSMPTMGTCTGSEEAAIFGCVLLTSYLFLFVAFYRKTYNNNKARKGTATKKPSAAKPQWHQTLYSGLRSLTQSK